MVPPLSFAPEGNAAGVLAVKTKAQEYAKEMQAVVSNLQAQGKISLGGLAEALNEGGYKTPRGGAWHKTSVKNLINRFTTHLQ